MGQVVGAMALVHTTRILKVLEKVVRSLAKDEKLAIYAFAAIGTQMNAVPFVRLQPA